MGSKEISVRRRSLCSWGLWGGGGMYEYTGAWRVGGSVGREGRGRVEDTGKGGGDDDEQDCTREIL